MNEFIIKLTNYFQNPDPFVFWLMMITAILLSLYLAYKIMGIGGVLGILVVLFFVYVLYTSDSFSNYREKQMNEYIRTEMLNTELQKDAQSD